MKLSSPLSNFMWTVSNPTHGKQVKYDKWLDISKIDVR